MNTNMQTIPYYKGNYKKEFFELGKVMKFGTSRTLFSWRNGPLKIVWADSAPNPTSIGLITVGGF